MTADIREHLLRTTHCLKLSTCFISFHLLLRITPPGPHYHHPHLTDAEAEAGKAWNNLLKVTPLMNGRSSAPRTLSPSPVLLGGQEAWRNQVRLWVCQIPGEPSWVSDEVGQSSHSTVKSYPTAFLFPEPFIFRRICTFIIRKPSMKQGAKCTCIVINSIYFHLYLKMCGEVIFFLCAHRMSKCQDGE